MFMRFRGGGVGHMASRHWDGFLQSDCPKFKARKDETFDTEYSGSDVDSDSDSDGQENDEVVEDIVAGNGEELDDAIYIEEGYGAPLWTGISSYQYRTAVDDILHGRV
ncbi:hypothetical protein EDC04DRAFT_2608460 [Pisolithus marmoratus]|nr:hypothetical protein EDC04DRAFT_2608460 [Pisolithus marmoratus]